MKCSLPVDDFLAACIRGTLLLDEETLHWLAVQHTSLQVEVEAGAVGIDGPEGRLDGGAAVDEGDDGVEVQVLEADILASCGTLLICRLEHRPVCAWQRCGLLARRRRLFAGCRGIEIAAEGPPA